MQPFHQSCNGDSFLTKAINDKRPQLKRVWGIFVNRQTDITDSAISFNVFPKVGHQLTTSTLLASSHIFHNRFKASLC